MRATFFQSWTFFTNNYRTLAIAMAVLALAHWLLVPDMMHKKITIDSTNPEAIEQLLKEIDFFALAVFLLATEVLALLFFTCLFREIILSPERKPGHLFLPALKNTLSAFVSFMASTTLVYFAGVAVLMLLALFMNVLGAAVIQAVGITFFIYIGLRLALLPQVVAQERRVRPLLFISESLRLTKNRVLKILAVFACSVLAVITISALTKTVAGGSESSPGLLLQIVELVLLVHLKVFFWIVFYRIYLDAVHDPALRK